MAYSGDLSSPASHPTALDLIGSDGTARVSVRSHLEHSNNRCSKPSGPGDTSSSLIRRWHRRHRGRSSTVVSCLDGDTLRLHFYQLRCQIFSSDETRTNTEAVVFKLKFGVHPV